MLHRQKALLALIGEAGRRASRLQVTKWAFLLREEAPGHGGASFYRFVPYQYGPFSFCLYQEAARLVQCGYLSEPDERTWETTPEGLKAADGLPESVWQDVVHTLHRYRGLTNDRLIKHVYDRYPWYTLKSRIGPRCAPPAPPPPAVFTAGYGGLLVDAFLDMLLRNGIQRVIDVRNNPVSRRYGFHKGTLARLCGNLGLEYAHHPELGIPSAERVDLEGPGDYEALFSRYEDVLLPGQRPSVRAVADLVASRPSALLCAEADPASCHRSRLARAVAGLTDLPVKHLEPAA